MTSAAGRRYLEAGHAVLLITLSRPARATPHDPILPTTVRAPRNALIKRQDGTLAVRPFRGLRRAPDPERQPDES